MKSFLLCFVVILCLNFIDGYQFRCDYTYNADAKGWFKYVGEPATWRTAWKQCEKEGAVLASPTVNEVDDAIATILNSTASEQNYAIFTGIHATPESSGYRDAEGNPFDNFEEWDPNHPDNKGKNMCVIMYNNGDGTLKNVSCAESYPYICFRRESKDEKITECGTVDPAYHLDKRTNKCYKFHDVTRNFAGAVVKCTAEGGHLAIINSDTEAKVLAEIFSQHPEHTLSGTRWREIAWVGIHNFDRKRDWRTIHGQVLEEAGYGRFSPGEPNNAGGGQYCGSIYRNGLIDDMFCYEPAVFICEKSPEYDSACHPPDQTRQGFYIP